MNALRISLLSIVLATMIAAPALAANGYIACNSSDDVIPFDLTTYATGTAIPLPHTYPYPYDATMTPDGTEVWVVDASGDHVVVVDVGLNAITHTIPVGEYPSSVVFTDDGSTALVSARDGDFVTLIKTSDYSISDSLYVLTGSGGIYDGPGQMALCPVSKNIYAVDWYDDTLYEIDQYGSSVLRSANVGAELWQLVCDPDGQYIYVTDRDIAAVRVIDRVTLTEVRTVTVGADPWGIDVTMDGSKLVVACEDDSNVYVIDTSDWSTTMITLDAGCDPRDVDILDADGYAFVAGGAITATDPVYVIQLSDNTLKSSIPVGGNPSCIAVQPQMTSADVGIGDESPVVALRLECHPNPFNPKTSIAYYMPEAGVAEVCVYDAAGRRIAVLAEGMEDAGDHVTYWDGTSDAGGSVASGVYFVRFDALGGRRTVKAVLLK